MYCQYCGRQSQELNHVRGAAACARCTEHLQGNGSASWSAPSLCDPASPNRGTGAEGRYPALRTVASAYRICAVAWGCIWLLACAVCVTTQATGGGSPLALLVSLGFCVTTGVVGALTLVAMAEGIEVLLDIEDNTRRAAAR